MGGFLHFKVVELGAPVDAFWSQQARPEIASGAQSAQQSERNPWSLKET